MSKGQDPGLFFHFLLGVSSLSSFVLLSPANPLLFLPGLGIREGKENCVTKFQFPSKAWKSCSFFLIPSTLSWLWEAPVLCAVPGVTLLSFGEGHAQLFTSLVSSPPSLHISMFLPVTVGYIYWVQVCFCIFKSKDFVISFLHVFCLTHG